MFRKIIVSLFISLLIILACIVDAKSHTASINSCRKSFFNSIRFENDNLEWALLRELFEDRKGLRTSFDVRHYKIIHSCI